MRNLEFNSNKSNIKIKSNIYVRSPGSLSEGDHPEMDPAFVSRIFSEPLLAELKKRAEQNGVKVGFSEVQQRVLKGETDIRLSDISSSDKAERNRRELNELSESGFGNERTLIVCADGRYAGFVSYLLHKRNIPHRLTNRSAVPLPVRHFADVLWDCSDRVISEENFIKRFTARCPDEAARAEECFGALCGFAGSTPRDGLDLLELAEKITRGELPDAIFGTRDDKITVSDAEKYEPEKFEQEKFERVYVLENGFDDPAAAAESLHAELLKITSDGVDSLAVTVDGGDVDRLSFIGGVIGESGGDAVRRQAYISQNIRRGDALRLELKGGVYYIVHGSMTVGRMKESFSERVRGQSESLPHSIDGMIVTDVVSVVSLDSERGEAVPSQFRDRSFWLGIELSGFVR